MRGAVIGGLICAAFWFLVIAAVAFTCDGPPLVDQQGDVVELR